MDLGCKDQRKRCSSRSMRGGRKERQFKVQGNQLSENIWRANARIILQLPQVETLLPLPRNCLSFLMHARGNIPQNPSRCCCASGGLENSSRPATLAWAPRCTAQPSRQSNSHVEAGSRVARVADKPGEMEAPQPRLLSISPQRRC